MTHLWIRAEQREDEQRVGITPQGVADLMARGVRITVEDSTQRAIPIADYAATGCDIAAEGAWPDAPQDAIIFGLKELPDDGTPLPHRHIMFGHAYKDQPAGQILLKRFKAGGGTLLDLEYLTDTNGRRIAAFGYWAGFAGAAVAVHCLSAQQSGQLPDPMTTAASADDLVDRTKALMTGTVPDCLIIGALGRVGTGARDFCARLGVATTLWDMAETAHGGPFPEILDHTIFLNCILAHAGTPVFVPNSAKTTQRNLRVIGDIACDPDSDFSPIRVYNRTTTWQEPCLRVHDTPPLDVTAIDNLPAILPVESSTDFAAQLLPHLADMQSDVWKRANDLFHTKTVSI